MQVKSCCFTNLNLMPFFAVPVAVALASSDLKLITFTVFSVR